MIRSPLNGGFNTRNKARNDIQLNRYDKDLFVTYILHERELDKNWIFQE